MIEVFRIFLIYLYWLTTFFYFIYFFSLKTFFRILAQIFLFSCLLFHFSYLLYTFFVLETFPVVNAFETFSWLSFIVAVLYFVIQQKSKVKTMGIFVLPMVSILQTISSVFATVTPAMDVQWNSHILALHTLSAIIGYSSFIISGIFGLLYIILYYNIKHTKFDVFFDRLPSLEVLNTVREKTTLLGLILLFIAISLGFFWKLILYKTILFHDVKVITVCIIFLLYLVDYFLGLLTKTSIVRLCFINCFGVLLMLFSLIVVNFLLETFHSFQ